ncbi:DNA topoisomerase I DNA binding eukaryotic-type [Trinorchestia longiramus]|nr:DNA topoisomerase I DNA binding eukaryotic-type [Trinorchestia longiramus]
MHDTPHLFSFHHLIHQKIQSSKELTWLTSHTIPTPVLENELSANSPLKQTLPTRLLHLRFLSSSVVLPRDVSVRSWDFVSGVLLGSKSRLALQCVLKMAEVSPSPSKDFGDNMASNGLTNGITNGTANGHSDSSKHRDKDRHKSSHKEKDRDRERHSSSSKSSHKDKDRDKDRSRDRDKERKDRDKDKDRDRDKDKDRHKSSSSSDKHKSSSSSDKHKTSSSSSDKHRDKDKHRSSSSGGDKSKHHSSSSEKDRIKDKERSEKDRSDRDKNDKHKSSSEKDRQDKDKRHSSSGEKKDRDKDRHHSSSKSSHKDKHREKERPKDQEKDQLEVKQEFITPMKEEALDTSQDTSLNTTQESWNDTFMDRAPEASAESEEDTKLVIEEHQAKEESDLTTREEDVALAYPAHVKEEADDDDDDDDDEEEEEEEEEDDVPLAARKRVKPPPADDEDDEDDDVPLAMRKKMKKEASDSDDDVPLAARKKAKKKRKKASSDEEDEDFKPASKKPKVKKEKTVTPKRGRAAEAQTPKSPTKKVKKESEEEKNVWKWWEEEKNADGRKWTFLEHKGIVFADPYQRLPPNVLMKYDGKPIVLSPDAEEVAGFYARMLEHDYVTKENFNKNFFKDFRKVMTPKEREIITDLSKCDFRKMHAYFVEKNEERKNRTKEEKKALKDKNDKLIEEYGWCIIDGHKQRIGNFKAEPPGLFRGRGDHPKMGMLKHRIRPEDVIINCSKDSKIPQPPEGHKWKEVRHDNQVTWLASWTENVQGQVKYVMMNAASKLKGEKDWQKYETARRLHQVVDRIRDQYKLDWKSKEMRIRQRSVALYFIDKLALRAGNEKDEDQADTVGCCSLRVEHITLHDEKDGKECVVAFDFLGKDSIRYFNEVSVEKRVFKNVKLFMENKAPADDLFDRLNTQIMNKHLNELMEGLTAKVFRTYNASRTLQEQLNKMTNADDDLAAKVLSYNRANREVAILCNHQRSVPKTFDQSMANLQKKIDDKKEMIEEAEKDLKTLKRQAKQGGSVSEKAMYDKKKKQVDRLQEQLRKLEISATDKEENKQIALGTSKLNYLDPRISVAWCKKFDVPIERVYNKTQRMKFQWAIEMATDDYDFMAPPTSQARLNSTNDDEEEDYQEEDDS